jgi:cyclopropane fatty-acyl-phospholipid synthase-like methyltransferase
MTNTELPFSPSADRNKEPIAEALSQVITKEDRNIFEIGSGTGQHAVYLGSCFSHLYWQTSDLKENHKTISAYIDQANMRTLLHPVEFEAGVTKLPRKKFDLVYTANTFHIMSWKKVKTILKSIDQILIEGGQFIIYGPFNFNGEYTSDSNREFDESLKARDPNSGIRSFEDIKSNLEKSAMVFSQKIDMPANNHILVFTKITKEK